MTTLTYAEAAATTYKDWFYVDAVGANYSSYFITGYKVHGGGLRKFQGNYLVVFSQVETNSSAFVQYLWDYATVSTGHRFSTAEQVYVAKSYVSYVPKRLWLRGQGLALQIKFYSEAGKPFNLIGYSIFETGNANL